MVTAGSHGRDVKRLAAESGGSPLQRRCCTVTEEPVAEEPAGQYQPPLDGAD